MFNNNDDKTDKSAHSEESELDKSVKKIRKLLGNDFHYLKHIGFGISGDVYLGRYTGHDENIKRLCDDQGRLCIKIAGQNYHLNDEAVIAENLFQKYISSSGHHKHIVGLPIKNQDAIVALCMNYISFKETTADSVAFSLKSFLKRFYQSIVNGHVNLKEFTDKILNGLYQDIGIFCVQLINEMQSILSQFNAMGYLHLDIGPRNFILNKPVFDSEGNFITLSLVLCDYGLSGKCNDQGVVNTLHQANKKPLTARDYQDIAENNASVRTDIFALKTAIIGMISLIVSDVMHDYSILNIGQKSIEHFFTMRTEQAYFKSDSIVLTQFLQSMMSLISYCPDRHVRNQINQVILFFREYILTLPENILSGEMMHQLDENKLLSANEKYFNCVIDSKVANIENINDNDELVSILLTFKRLMIIPVTVEFKNSSTYQQITAIDTVDKLKNYLIDKIKIEKMSVQHAPSGPKITEGSLQIEWIEKINQYLYEWRENKKENFQEIKWFGQEMESRTNLIINSIIAGKIKSLADAQDEYIALVRAIEYKINERKQSAYHKQPSVLSKMTLNTAGYVVVASRQNEAAPLKVPKNASGYEGEQIIQSEQKENVHPRQHRKWKDKK